MTVWLERPGWLSTQNHTGPPLHHPQARHMSAGDHDLTNETSRALHAPHATKSARTESKRLRLRQPGRCCSVRCRSSSCAPSEGVRRRGALACGASARPHTAQGSEGRPAQSQYLMVPSQLQVATLDGSTGCQMACMHTWSWHLILRKTLHVFQSQNQRRPSVSPDMT